MPPRVHLLYILAALICVLTEVTNTELVKILLRSKHVSETMHTFEENSKFGIQTQGKRLFQATRSSKSCETWKYHIINFVIVVACFIELGSNADFASEKQKSESVFGWKCPHEDGINIDNLHSSMRPYEKLSQLPLFEHFESIPIHEYWTFPFSLGKYLKQVERSGLHFKHMNYEWGRYETFKNFPMDTSVMPTRLSSNGFYYTGAEDIVECFSCHLRYCDWKDGDDPKAIHQRLSPDCEFVRGTDSKNVPIHSSSDSTADNVGYEADGATGGDLRITESSFRDQTQSRENASLITGTPLHQSLQSGKAEESGGNRSSRRINHKFPDYEHFQCRIDSFNGWPCADLLRPEALVIAGFFYAGFSDCVRCFSCGGGLRNWEYGDGPWEEHARWFPWCKFLREQKGIDFVNEHQVADTETVDDISTDITDIVSGEEAMNVIQENKTQHAINCHKKSKENANIKDAERCKNKDETSEANNKSISSTNPNVIKEENNKLKEQLLCKICMDRDSNVVFLPCGHKVSCESCAPRIRKCAVCRVPIKGRVKAFMS